jgi:MFS family permease
VVAGCFVVLTTTSGLGFYGLAVYLNVFSREKGWDVSSISLATTLFFVVSGLFGLVIARLLARYDPRWVVAAGGVAGAGALALLGQVEQRWQLYAVYALFAVGFSAAGLIPATTVVTRWYHRRRSVALSIASTGLSVGGILLTPAAKALLDRVDLSTGTPILGLVFLAGTVPFALVLIRPDPAVEGWMPDGERIVTGEPAPRPTGVAYTDAVSSRFFVATTVGYVLVLGSQVGAIQQLIKLVEDRTDAETAAFATVFLAGTSVVARLIGGRLVTTVPMIGFTASLAVVQATSLVLLGVAQSTAMLFAAIVLLGATIGNILMLQPLLIAERFGVLDYPRIFSRSQVYTMFGTAGGPLLLGYLYDHAGGHRTSYLVGALGSLCGGLVLWSAGAAVAAVDDDSVTIDRSHNNVST